jgi:hypothetical protein
MDYRITIDGKSGTISRFDYRGNLKKKDLQRFLRNAELSKEMFASEIFKPSGNEAVIKGYLQVIRGLISVTKAVIIETRRLGTASIAIGEAQIDKRNIRTMSLSVWEQKDIITGIDFSDVTVAQVFEQMHEVDFVVLKADKTN